MVLAVAIISGCSGSGSIGLSDLPSDIRVNLSSQQEGIWVSGSGKVSATPDIAILQLGIEAQETSVAQAQSKAAGAMDAVMTTLKDNGVAEKDIQTQYFNIHRVTRWDENKGQEVVIGYRVTNIVTAKIRTMDEVGAIVDDVAVAGGDLTRIDSVAFSIEDPSGYQEEAREKAIADAQAKAGQLAGQAGVKLGSPTYISESSYLPSPIYPARSFGVAEAMPAPMPTSISPGEMEVTVSVQISYAIAN
jgi:uncharacterized protein YggE